MLEKLSKLFSGSNDVQAMWCPDHTCPRGYVSCVDPDGNNLCCACGICC